MSHDLEFIPDPFLHGRPDTTQCLLHPYFWDSSRRLTFLTDVSDRFEIMCREPKDEHLLELEKDAQKIVGNDWQARLDKMFIENLGKFRKYDPKSIQDLLRALRNKVCFPFFFCLCCPVKRKSNIWTEKSLSGSTG